VHELVLYFARESEETSCRIYCSIAIGISPQGPATPRECPGREYRLEHNSLVVILVTMSSSGVNPALRAVFKEGCLHFGHHIVYQ
jgi:hypothetical protein